MEEGVGCQQYRKLAVGIDEYVQDLHSLELSSDDVQSYNLEQKIKVRDEDFKTVSKPIIPPLGFSRLDLPVYQFYLQIGVTPGSCRRFIRRRPL